MSPLEAARTTLANYDAPRCGATFAHVFTDNSGCGIEAVTRTCRRHAGHPTDGREGHSEFGDRIPGPDHLRTALAEVDRLTAERDRLALTLRCERGKWAPDAPEGAGWTWHPEDWEWTGVAGARSEDEEPANLYVRHRAYWGDEDDQDDNAWAWLVVETIGMGDEGDTLASGTAPTALEAIDACNAAIVGAS